MNNLSLADFDGIEMDGLEFCSKVFRFFEQHQNGDGGTTKIRLRTSPLENKLLGELLPICTYILANYSLGNYLFVRWVDGTQSFDAEIIAKGFYPEMADCALHKEYLEVTIAMDPDEYLCWQALEQNGIHHGRGSVRRSKERHKVISERIECTRDFVAEDAAMAIKRITKKTEISYPENTTLIMPCYLAMKYISIEWERFLCLIKRDLPQHNFKEIFLFEESGRGYKARI